MNSTCFFHNIGNLFKYRKEDFKIERNLSILRQVFNRTIGTTKPRALLKGTAVETALIPQVPLRCTEERVTQSTYARHRMRKWLILSQGTRKSSRCFSSGARESRDHNRTEYVPKSSHMRQRNINFLAWSLAAAVCTIGLSYASVPLYRIFCQVTGYGGTVQIEPNVQNGSWSSYVRPADTSVGSNVQSKVDGDSGERQTRVERQNRLRIREDAKPINIRFNADVNAAMPISFVPRQATVQVLPGEAALAFYTAQNRANEDIVGIATYNVVPAKAGIYFNKIQCFCFEEQRFKAGERIDMPVLFFIDREFYDDPRMVDVDTIILSYTFFRAQDVSPEFLAEQQRKALGLAMD
jgi:cytochrome c oxidase assembly protein subunit 11